MVFINEHYLKLPGGYIFPEIARRVAALGRADPAAANRIIHCGIGDVTEPLPPVAVSALNAAAAELSRRETFRGYGPAVGYGFLQECIARHDFRERGLQIDASEIFVSDGAKGDCGDILEILGSGNHVAVADPVYPVYIDTNVMAGNTKAICADGGYGGVMYLPCTPENDFVPAPPKAEKAELIYLCYPNNPTGAMISREQLSEWVGYAMANDSIILYDVAYEAYISEPDLPRSIYEIPDARRCAIEFHSFSKNGGFTGVRCGYTVCPRSVTGKTREGRSVGLHELWTRRFQTRSNGVSYVVQRAAEALYTPDGQKQVAALIEHYLANARILREGCRRLGLAVYGGVHAPYVWVACPEGVDSWGLFERLLEEANVVVIPGAGFGRCGEGFVRISAFNTRQNVEEVVRRLAEIRL